MGKAVEPVIRGGDVPIVKVIIVEQGACYQTFPAAGEFEPAGDEKTVISDGDAVPESGGVAVLEKGIHLKQVGVFRHIF